MKPLSGERSKVLDTLDKQAKLKIGFTETFDSVTQVHNGPMEINGAQYEVVAEGFGTYLCDHCTFCVPYKPEQGKPYTICKPNPAYNGKALGNGPRFSITGLQKKLRGRLHTGIGISVMDKGKHAPREVKITAKAAKINGKAAEPNITYQFTIHEYPPSNLDSSLDAGTYAFVPIPNIMDLESIDIQCLGTGGCLISTVDYFYVDNSNFTMMHLSNIAAQLTRKAGKSVTTAYAQYGLPLDIYDANGFTTLGLGITCSAMAHKPYEEILLNLTNEDGKWTSENLRPYFTDHDLAKEAYGWFMFSDTYTNISLELPDADCHLNIVDTVR